MDKELIAGALAGSLAAFVVVPLDIVKIRKQYGGSSKVSTSGSTLHCLREILSKEGFHSLYRGSVPSVFGYLCSWSCYFAIYGTMRKELQKSTFNASVVDLVSATSAGFASTTITSPIWVVRTKIMLLQHSKASQRQVNALQVIRQTWNQSGLAGFWAGLSPSYLGLMHVAIQWPTYEYMRREFARIMQSDIQNNNVVLAASLCAKVIASVSTYPHEVLRTRMQTGENRLSLVGTFKSICQREGALALYRGLSTSLIRQLPTTAVVFVAHNSIMRILEGASTR
jgi:solute carrier family 25 folate transporter 32